MNLSIDGETNILYGGPDPTNIEQGVLSLGEWCLRKIISLNEQDVCLIDGVSGKPITILEIKNTSCCIAENLLQLQPNDSIAIYAENRNEYAFLSFGTLFAGKKLVPINAGYTERELSHALHLVMPTILFTSLIKLKTVMEVVKKTDFIKHIIVFDTPKTLRGTTYNTSITDYQSFVSNIRKDYSHFKCQPQNMEDHVSLILYSSGTTGLPKAVQLTDQNLMLRYSRELLEPNYASVEKKIYLNIVPFAHVFGYFSLILRITTGHILISLPQFKETQFLENIEKYKVNYMSLVPPIMVMLAKSPLIEKYNLSSIKEIIVGAAPLSKELHDAVFLRLNSIPKIRQVYGLTETTGLVTKQTDQYSKPGSIGRLATGILGRVVCLETKLNVGPNHHGELLFKGKTIMKGYVGNETATQNMIDENGWLHSGDIGYYDEDGEFFIVDRLKELIKYKGNQMAPAELESILLEHPHINDAGVIGVPDEEAGELPMAFVVKKANHQITEKEIFDFLAERASSVKRLRGGIKFVDQIPKSSSGKILRRLLRASINMKSKL